MVRAFNGSDSSGKAVGGSGGGGYRGGLDPALEMAVPSEQRPVNELSALRQASLYSWVSHGAKATTPEASLHSWARHGAKAATLEGPLSSHRAVHGSPCT